LGWKDCAFCAAALPVFFLFCWPRPPRPFSGDVIAVIAFAVRWCQTLSAGAANHLPFSCKNTSMLWRASGINGPKQANNSSQRAMRANLWEAFWLFRDQSSAAPVTRCDPSCTCPRSDCQSHAAAPHVSHSCCVAGRWRDVGDLRRSLAPVQLEFSAYLSHGRSHWTLGLVPNPNHALAGWVYL
jgi:hypothetical protein